MDAKRSHGRGKAASRTRSAALRALGALALLAPLAGAGETEDWAAAMALKQAQRGRDAAAAFEAIARTYPQSARAGEALVEAGVGWFGVARGEQVLHRCPPQARETFARALGFFRRVVEERPGDPSAGRAQYMCGSVHLFLGDLAEAERAYGRVLDRFPEDQKYAPKALERRAFVRRHRLDAQGALEDLARHSRDHAKGEDSASVARYLQLMQSYGKPAPELQAELWLQGEPQSLAALRGDVVAVYFFASWCENCAAEKAFVLDLHRRFEERGLRWVGVVDRQRGQTPETLRPFLAKEGLPFPVMLDRGPTIAAYEATKIPELVLIDRLGRVRWHDNVANLADETLETLLTEDPALVKDIR